MAIIKNLEEIDWVKFDKSFSIRNTPLLNPDFYQHLHKAFFTPEANLEVHQCNCGQVFIIKSREFAKVGSESSCKLCDPSLYQAYHKMDFKPREEFIKLLDMIDDLTVGDSPKNWVTLLNQYEKAFPKAYIRPDGNEIPSPFEAIEKMTTLEIKISQSALKKFQDLFQI